MRKLFYFLTACCVLLLIFKFGDNQDIPYLWVFAPYWIPAGMFLILIVLLWITAPKDDYSGYYNHNDKMDD